jgi:hypothetical protein
VGVGVGWGWCGLCTCCGGADDVSHGMGCGWCGWCGWCGCGCRREHVGSVGLRHLVMWGLGLRGGPETKRSVLVCACVLLAWCGWCGWCGGVGRVRG